MHAGDTWTLNFTALRDEAGLPQIFSIKSLRNSPAQIKVTLTNATHNTALGEYRVASNGRTLWPVPKDIIIEGANTIIIERKDGGTRDFLIDAMELGGSLGVGKKTASSTDDGRVGPEIIRTGIPSVADPNPQHWPQKLDSSTGVTDFHFRVWVDPDVADMASFTFRTAVLCDTADSGNFEVYVNNAYKTKVNAIAEWKQYTLNPGKLHGGWNDFDFISTDSHIWEFGYYRFETVLPDAFGYPLPHGTAISIR